MRKSNCLLEVIIALKCVVQTLFKEMPVLFLVLIYMIDLVVRSYLSEGFSKIYLLGFLILAISIGIYVSTKSFSETTLSFILGVLTIYSIDWEKANFTLFMILYLAYVVIAFYISVIRYLSFRHVIIGEYEEAIKVVELLKAVCQIDLIYCCEIYYGFYTYCYNKSPIPPNISREVEKMFDRVTTLSISYSDFFDIFSQTKRILVEEKVTYDQYLLKIKLLSLKGYSSLDIIEIMKHEYLAN